MSALQSHQKQGNVNHEEMRWNLVAFEFFGRIQLEEAASEAKYCVLPDRKLVVANLRALTGIRVLDLSRNNLSSISGLGSLSLLIFADFSNNPKLSLSSTLTQLHCSSLQQVLFHTAETKNHPRSDPTKRSYREQVILNACISFLLL